MDKEAIEKILREQLITIGIDVEDAKTGQMWAFDVKQLARKICELPKDKPPLLSDETMEDTFQASHRNSGRKEIFGAVAQAQREICIKWYEG